MAGKTICASGGIAYNSRNLFDVLDIQAFDGEVQLMYIIHRDGVVLFRSSQENAITGYNMINSLEKDRFVRGSHWGTAGQYPQRKAGTDDCAPYG